MSHIAFSGGIAIWAIKEGQYEYKNFTGTTVGLQAAIDWLGGTKGEVFVGPGTLSTTTTIWLHSGTHLRGAGPQQTVIKRATGSLGNGDAANSGMTVATSAYGSNGTLSSSSETLADISVSELTIDGNQSAFGSVTQANLVPAGLCCAYTDGVRITHVKVKNTLGDGFRVHSCRNVSLSDTETDTTGQWGTLAARNAVNFIGNARGVGAWGYNYRLTGANLVTTGDEAIQVSQIDLVTISDVTVDGCDFVLECSPGVSGDASCSDWTISNISARNALSYFMTFASGAASGYTMTNVAISNCVFEGHASDHDGGCLALPTSASFIVNGLSLVGCVFRNINTKDTTTRHWVDSQPADATGMTGLVIADCQFYGKSGSTRTGAENGINLRGSHQDVFVSNVLIKDMAGTAVRLNDTTAYAGTVARDIKFSNVTVDTCNDFAFRITATAGSSAASLTDIYFTNCTAKNCSAVTSGAAFQLFCSQAGATIARIFLTTCRVYQTSGSNITYGLDFTQSAGTVGPVYVVGCDFSGAATNWMVSSGTITGVHFTPPTGLGTATAASATFIMPQNGDTFHVTGSTNITNGITVRPWDSGRTVKLIFDSTPTVSDTGTSKLQGDFVATADDVLTLTCDGTNWYEAARSPN